MRSNYFSSLNYTLANEDTSLELSVLPSNVSHLMSVAGSGGRVLPLLAKAPQRVTCVDLSQQQLFITELRIESLRTFQHSEFLAFWGYAPDAAEPQERKNLFRKIHLPSETRSYFQELFESVQWGSILYSGKWEKTVATLSRITRKITGFKGMGLFSAMTLSEQKKYLENTFPTYSWLATLHLIGHAGVFNALLYKGNFPIKNIPESYFEFYNQAFERLFQQAPARENFLLQLVFFGKILFSEGNPIECNPHIFRKAKQGLKTAKIEYIQGCIIEECKKSTTPIDFLSLSDVPSYFKREQERNFMQKIIFGMAIHGLLVIRNYLRVPDTDITGFQKITSNYASAIKKEKIQLYKIDIFKKEGTVN